MIIVYFIHSQTSSYRTCNVHAYQILFADKVKHLCSINSFGNTFRNNFNNEISYPGVSDNLD